MYTYVHACVAMVIEAIITLVYTRNTAYLTHNNVYQRRIGLAWPDQNGM